MNARPGGRAHDVIVKLCARSCLRNPSDRGDDQSVSGCAEAIRLGILIRPAMTDSSLPNLPGTAPGAAMTSGPAPAARAQVIELLQARFAEDHLTMDEFERRVAAAYQAKSVADLDALVGDLRPASAALVVPERGKLSAIFSSNDRDSSMVVPRWFEITAVFGNVELDLSDATFGSGVTDIHISAVFGNVELSLPLGMRIDCAGEGIAGVFDCRVASPSGHPAPGDAVVRITGHSIFASVQVTARTPRSAQLQHDEPRRLR